MIELTPLQLLARWLATEPALRLMSSCSATTMALIICAIWCEVPSPARVWSRAERALMVALYVSVAAFSISLQFNMLRVYGPF